MYYSGIYICCMLDELVINIKVNVLSGKMFGYIENVLIELFYNIENKYIIKVFDLDIVLKNLLYLNKYKYMVFVYFFF